MKRYRVIVSPRVVEQIEAQLLHIAESSVNEALKWEDRLRDAIRQLSTTRGFAVDEPATERLGVVVRKYVFEGTYLVHYVVNEADQAVLVINFRHGMRLPRQDEP